MAGLLTSSEQDMLGNIIQQRQQANQALASPYGKYGGIVQAAAGMADTGADAMAGGGVGAADPRMRQMQAAKAIMTKVAKEVGSVTSATFFERLSQELAVANFPEQAQKAADKAAEVKKQEYSFKGLENEEKARGAVAELLKKNPNATSTDMLEAVAPFSTDPTAMIKVLSAKEEKIADRVAKADEARRRAEERMAEIKQRGADALERAREMNASREDIARIAAQSREDMSRSIGEIRLQITKENNTTRREIEAAKRNTGVLAPSLQKDESKDLEQIDNFEALASVLEDPIKSLQGTDTSKPLDISPGAVAKYMARNISGYSTPESRAYSALQEAVRQAVNIKTDAARGVQTDKDVLRFANALIEKSAGTDTKATLDALTRFRDANLKAANDAKVRVNSRRQSQNVGKYYSDLPGSPSEQSGQSGTPKATKRYNRSTGKFEVITGG